MKRDMDLCRAILFEIENSDEVHSFHDISVDGYSEQQIFYHVKLLHDAGLVEAHDGSTMAELRWFAQRLTWTGHEFLDATRDETIWNKAKTRVAGELGSVPFVIVRDVVTQLARGEFAC